MTKEQVINIIEGNVMHSISEALESEISENLAIFLAHVKEKGGVTNFNGTGVVEIASDRIDFLFVWEDGYYYTEFKKQSVEYIHDVVNNTLRFYPDKVKFGEM